MVSLTAKQTEFGVQIDQGGYMSQRLDLEQVLKLSLDMSPDCFCVADEQCIIFCNENFADVYGVSAAEVIGSNHDALFKLAWESKKGIKIETGNFDTWLKELKQLQKDNPVSQFETDLHDGRWFHMTRVTLDNGLSVVWGSDITKLKQAQKSLEEANQRIEEMANTDQLTGVNNRRAFESIAAHELTRATRYQQALSLLVLDIDYFKRINDTYGHDAGDAVLRQFASLCESCIRESDILCRIGGEEFVILLSMTDNDAAIELAQRLRCRVAEYDFYLEALSKTISVTVSVGISQLKEGDKEIKSVLARADSALYEAKSAGRNQIKVYRKLNKHS